MNRALPASLPWRSLLTLLVIGRSSLLDTDPLFETPIGSFDPYIGTSSNDDKPLLPQQRRWALTNRYAPVDFNAYTTSGASLAKHAAHQANAFHAGAHGLPAESYTCSALQAEVNDISVTGEHADHFQPEPARSWQILAMPEHIKVHWINSFTASSCVSSSKWTLLAKTWPSLTLTTSSLSAQNIAQSYNPTGTIEKLKIQICLHDDLQSACVRWTLGVLLLRFRALKIFLCRVHQLDFIGVFFQSFAIDCTIIRMLLIEWKELFPEYAIGLVSLCFVWKTSMVALLLTNRLTFISPHGSKTINVWFIAYLKVPSSFAEMAISFSYYWMLSMTSSSTWATVTKCVSNLKLTSRHILMWNYWAKATGGTYKPASPNMPASISSLINLAMLHRFATASSLH